MSKLTKVYRDEYKVAQARSANAGIVGTRRWNKLINDDLEFKILFCNSFGARLPGMILADNPLHLSCMDATMLGFVYARVAGLDVEVVLGDIIDGSGDGFFETSKNKLLEEYKAQVFEGAVASVHCWLQLSQGAIADFTGHKYLHVKEWDQLGTHPNAPVHLENLKEDRWRNNLKYKPLLIGAELLHSMNPSPLFMYAVDKYDILNVDPGQPLGGPGEFFEGYLEVQDEYYNRALTEARSKLNG